MKTVIMAGGRGTRISEVFPDIPKPMIEIDGMPVLEREIYCLRDQGFTDIILTVGYKADVIIDYFGDGSKISTATGRPFGVEISYFVEEIPLGNAGALFQLDLKDDFLLLNADAIFDIDFNRMVDFHKSHNATVTLFTHPNSHPYDSGLIIADENHTVLSWLAKEDERPKYYKNRVNAGLHVISPSILACKPDTPKIDLDRQLLKPLAGTGKMYCYDSPEYVKDMGTPERYYSVVEDFKAGRVTSKNLRNKQKAVFLDRDGTINKYVGFLRNIDAFELTPGVADAVKKINASGYLAIVVTNQPVIARGEVSYSELDEIHNKMEMLLGLEGAYLDGIYFCPHHPHSGYEGEIPELKFDCDCRKPKPGMLLKAAEDFNIDLSSSWMVGDGENDIKAGKAAGCHTALLVGEGTDSKRGCDYGQDLTCESLLEFVKKLTAEIDALQAVITEIENSDSKTKKTVYNELIKFCTLGVSMIQEGQSRDAIKIGALTKEYVIALVDLIDAITVDMNETDKLNDFYEKGKAVDFLLLYSKWCIKLERVLKRCKDVLSQRESRENDDTWREAWRSAEKDFYDLLGTLRASTRL